MNSSLDTMPRPNTTARPRPRPHSWFFQRGISSLTVDVPSSTPSKVTCSTAPPRWKTREFYYHYLVFVIAVPSMVVTVTRLSRETHANYHHFQHRLSKGWLFGWNVVSFLSFPFYALDYSRRTDIGQGYNIQDTSDHQWYIFRSNLPILTIVLVIWLILSKTTLFLSSKLSSSPSVASPSHSHYNTDSSKSTHDGRPPRTTFIILFSLILLFLLHGLSLLKMLLILLLNYRISLLSLSKNDKLRKLTPLATWGFGIVVLFGNEIHDGYKFASLYDGLRYFDEAQWAKGILPRWQINWNITMLRLISFNIDRYWAVQYQHQHSLKSRSSAAGSVVQGLDSAPTAGSGLTSSSSQNPIRALDENSNAGLPRDSSLSSSRDSAEPATRDSTFQFPPRNEQSQTPSLEETENLLSTKSTTTTPYVLDDRTRVMNHHPLSSYSFISYLAYAFYPPLYLAGPIITFNSFVSQLYSPPQIPLRTITSYAIRFLSCLLTMELVLHSMYVVAIKDEARSGSWSGETPFELSMIGFWNLIVVWLKLLITWRFFRLWSLLDGIDPPENMIRCMANNYSTLGFWRSWHRSYNLWVIRYLYIPIGGTKRAFLATLVVFTFVAMWHDLSLKLLTWGWVVSLFVLPEMIAMKLVPEKKYSQYSFYRPLCALGGVFNILLMMTANLIGFAIGTEGMKYMWSRIVQDVNGWAFLIIAMICLASAVCVMFEYREEEKRKVSLDARRVRHERARETTRLDSSNRSANVTSSSLHTKGG